jgi:hypothetical protein
MQKAGPAAGARGTHGQGLQTRHSKGGEGARGNGGVDVRVLNGYGTIRRMTDRIAHIESPQLIR